MGKRKRNALAMRPAYVQNAIALDHFLDMLTNVAINTFEWINLPPEIDQRFLELTLLEKGFCLFFRDNIADRYVALTAMVQGQFNIYRVPSRRRAYAVNGYQASRTARNSIIIYNDSLRQPTWPLICYYAEKLAAIERSIDVNLKTTRTPLLICCEEDQRLTMKNLYAKYDGNEPVIFGNKNVLDPKAIQVLPTPAPYICDQLYTLKRQVLNEAMMCLGVENSNTEKSERLITDEVISNLGQTNAMRYTRLSMRKQACEEINNMFGLNIDVEFRRDLAPTRFSNGEEGDGNEPVHDGVAVSDRDGD